ncbi:MAG: hypothetical protein A2V52_03500 [Actinobacteria bacterium RBG_19FT_COMBO_54_7]|nr:MAG: hypothetical protein A2V52_03500 [Actinobacteria bacterium RBG_19FT_COMBO_54_7]
MAAKTKDSAKLKDRIRRKGERRLSDSKLKALRRDLKNAAEEKEIKAVALKYGIDPEPGKPGRPKAKKGGEK